MNRERHLDAAVIIDEVIERHLDGLEKDEPKLSISDLLRLLELRQQLTINEVREVEIRWVESNPEQSVTSR